MSLIDFHYFFLPGLCWLGIILQCPVLVQGYIYSVSVNDQFLFDLPSKYLYGRKVLVSHHVLVIDYVFDYLFDYALVIPTRIEPASIGCP